MNHVASDTFVRLAYANLFCGWTDQCVHRYTSYLEFETLKPQK
jgi:hypothetical protein